MAEQEAPKKVYVAVLLFEKQEDAQNFATALCGSTGMAVTVMNDSLSFEELTEAFKGRTATLYKKNPDAPQAPEQREPSYIA